MKQRYKIFLGAALLCGVLATSAYSQSSGENTTSGTSTFSKIGAGTGAYLGLPVGARATAMGASYVAIADDPTALFWNPAGITQIEGSAVSYSYSPMFASIAHNFAGVVFPIGGAYKVGLSALVYGTSGIPVTDMFNQDGTGATYSARDISIGATIAGQLTEQFSFGATAKYIDLAISNVSASTIAFDLSTLYKPGFGGLRIGFAVDNLAAPVKYTGTGLVNTGGVDPVTGNQTPDAAVEAGEASLPLTFRAGLSSDLMENDPMNKLLVSTEFSTAADRSEYVGLGAEYVWNNLLAVRAGYQLGSDDAWGISGGLGIKYQSGSFDGQIDYAIRPHKSLGIVNLITASVRLQ